MEAVDVLLMLSGLHTATANRTGLWNQDEEEFISNMISKYYKLYFKMKREENG
jgi:hypothetical protein